MRACLLAAMVALAACKNVAPDTGTRAIIVDPDDESRAALRSTVNEIFGRDVLLADDALTTSSLLVIERDTPRSIEGSPAQGRTMDMPYSLRLVTDGTNCILVDERDGSRHRLDDTDCVAE